MLKSELIEQNELLTTQNQRLASIVQAQMQWIVSIHEHYTATQRGLYTIIQGIDEARVDFKTFLADMTDRINAVRAPENDDAELP